MNNHNTMQEHPKSDRKYILVLCLAGLLINVLLARAAVGLKLPLFLDNIGSTLAAALGGYIPGIIVGLLTNMIDGIIDKTSSYYGSLTVLIAIAAAWFTNKGFYDLKKPGRLLVIIVTYTLIGGALGVLITWMMYGYEYGSGISGQLALRIHEAGIGSEFWFQFTADMLIDIVDKTITVLAVAFVLHAMPEFYKDRFYFYGWQYTPFSKENRMAAGRKNVYRMSLRKKVEVLVTLSMVIISTIITVISFVHYRSSDLEEQEQMARSIANVASRVLDADRVDEYIQLGEAAEGYTQIKNIFTYLARSYEITQFVYAYRILEDGCHVIIDADTPEFPGNKPGEIVEFDKEF